MMMLTLWGFVGIFSLTTALAFGDAIYMARSNRRARVMTFAAWAPVFLQTAVGIASGVILSALIRLL